MQRNFWFWLAGAERKRGAWLSSFASVCAPRGAIKTAREAFRFVNQSPVDFVHTMFEPRPGKISKYKSRKLGIYILLFRACPPVAGGFFIF
jgi:hypothetical protein